MYTQTCIIQESWDQIIKENFKHVYTTLLCILNEKIESGMIEFYFSKI